jgi:serine/threonine protein kinase
MDDYKIIKIIGSGSFSNVYKAMNKKTGEFVAIKRIKKLENQNKEKIIGEINIVKKLDNNNILKFIDVYESDRHMYLITELCDYSLSKIINNFLTEKEIHDVFCQIINGIKYLYDNNIIHRDIKPDNILIKDNVVRIADFGFAKEINESQIILNTICGSPLYMAPEILCTSQYDLKSDIWSLGVILYQMLYSVHPLGIVNNIIEMITKYKQETKIKFPQNKYSNDVIDLVKSMVCYDINKRIDWDSLFNNRWINSKMEDILLDENILFNSYNSVNNSCDNICDKNIGENNLDDMDDVKEIKENSCPNINNYYNLDKSISKIIIESKPRSIKINQKETDVNDDYFPITPELDRSMLKMPKNNNSILSYPVTIIKKTWNYFSY